MKKILKKISLGATLLFLFVFLIPQNSKADALSYKSLWDEEQGAYLISSVEELKIFRNSLAEHDYAGEKILLTKDITIQKSDDIGTVKTEWDVNSGSVFQGYFNGQGHQISGFYDNKAGLFNNIGKDGVVTKLILDVDITVETSIYYAPLANVVSGKIQYCGLKGSIRTVESETEKGFSISRFIEKLDAKTYNEDSDNLAFPLISDCCITVNVNIRNVPAGSANGIDGVISCADVYSENVYYIQNCYVGGTCQRSTSTGSKTAYRYVGSINDPYVNTATIFDSTAFLGEPWRFNAKTRATIITDEQAKTKTTYTKAGWDFDKVWDIDTEGYYDKIYLNDNQAPEGTQTFIDEIGPYYYDTELKFVNDGYPYLRADVLEPVLGSMERRMVTVSAVYPDMQIGYYTPAVIRPEVKITGIEGVDADSLQSFIEEYQLEVICEEEKQYLLEDTDSSVGSLSHLKDVADLHYKKNETYTFAIDYDNSTVTPGKLSAKPNPYRNLSNEAKAEAYLAIGEQKEIANLKNKLNRIKDGTSVPKQVIIDALCWDVINISRYDKNSEDKEIRELLDSWFAMELEGFKEMYAENQSMTQQYTTTWQRELIAITAAGYDPADIKAYTKGTHGEDDPGFDLVQSVFDEVGKDGAHMHVPFWLIGLDSGDYAADEAGVEKRVEMVYRLVNSGVFSAAAGIGMDYIGMFSQGLTKYIDPEEGTIYYEVAKQVNEKLKAEGKETIAEKADKERIVEAIKRFQCPLGGWITYDNYNPATTAQAVVMLSCMGVDAYGEALTTEAGYNMLDSFIQSGCNLDEDGLPVSLKDTYEMTVNESFYSSQSIYATISWYRLIKGQTALYDCTDVVGVAQVEAMIAGLPKEITLEQAEAVEAAKAAYDALSDGQKAYVEQADVLEAAVKVVEELKKAAEELTAFQTLKPQLKAALADYDQVKLTWTKEANAEGYKIYRASSKDGQYELVKTIKKAATVSWTDSKLTTGKTYYYKMSAYGTFDGEVVTSAFSKVVSAKPALKVPSLKAVSADYDQVKLTWKQINGTEGYKIYRASSKNGAYTAVKTIKDASVVTWTDSKLTTGKTYYYKVCGYSLVNGKVVKGGCSAVVSAKPVLKTPSLKAASAGYDQVKLTWKQINGTEFYKIYS